VRGPRLRQVNETPAARWRTLATRGIIAAIIVIALLLVGRRLGGSVAPFVQAVDRLGPAGPIAFIAGYAIACIALVPASLLTLAAGAIFGVVWGTLYTLAGAMIGATGAFLIARYAARGVVERRLADNPRFTAIDRAVGAEGLKIVTLLRLSPVVPFSLLNYALGLTHVRLADYLIAMIGIVPGTLLYVYYGKVGGDLAALATGVHPNGGTASTAVLILGLVATIAVTVLIGRIARRSLDHVIE
jgi:uncharacterized membrane protein YdjX (TVP38/TMEM64 family)